MFADCTKEWNSFLYWVRHIHSSRSNTSLWRNCVKCWGYTGERDRHVPPPWYSPPSVNANSSQIVTQRSVILALCSRSHRKGSWCNGQAHLTFAFTEVLKDSKVNQSLKIWYVSVYVIFTFKKKYSSGVNDMHAEVFREKCANVSKNRLC